MTNNDQSNQDATSPTNSEAVRSGDWVAELEAARTRLLVAESIMAEADDYRYEGQLGEAYGALMDILDTERRRSATVKL